MSDIGLGQAQMVVDADDVHWSRVRDRIPEIVFDFRPEGRQAPIVNDVFHDVGIRARGNRGQLPEWRLD